MTLSIKTAMVETTAKTETLEITLEILNPEKRREDCLPVHTSNVIVTKGKNPDLVQVRGGKTSTASKSICTATMLFHFAVQYASRPLICSQHLMPTSLNKIVRSKV